MEVFLDQIGNQLRSAREASGLTVDDVVFRTQLPKTIVIALENEDFSAFSSPLYAKSFLCQYSDFLRVDAQPWIDAIEPGSFMPNGMISRVVKVPEQTGIAIQPPAVQTRGGLRSVLGLLVISVGLVYIVIQGYDAFEARFGKELRTPPDPLMGAPAPVTPATSPVLFNPPPRSIPASEKEDENLAKPPPRAIIVR